VARHARRTIHMRDGRIYSDLPRDQDPAYKATMQNGVQEGPE
jgi:hypothetical protein